MKQISRSYYNFLCQTLKRFVFLSLLSLIPFTARAENKITISGISSGGFMASQMATTYSSQISGVGTVAGGFFYCAQNHLQEKIQEGRHYPFVGTRNLFLFEPGSQFYGDVITGQAAFQPETDNWFTPSVGNPIYQAVSICMQNPMLAKLPDLGQFEKNGLIDPVENLKSQQIYIYQGDVDTVVNPAMAKRLLEFYTQNQVDLKQIKTKTLPGAHNFPTDKKNLIGCGDQKMPYISSCDFNLAQDMLEHLLQKKLERTETNLLENLHRVDQNLEPMNESLPQQDWKSPIPSVASYGYLYASQACLENPASCELHIALHGCEMSDSFDHELHQKYQDQVVKTQVVGMIREKKNIPFWLSSISPANDERKLSYGTLKFAALSGYAELAEKNNLMVLFPQTWITAKNYPYNPKGCWDWFGVNGPDYATNKGVETSWLMDYAKRVRSTPKKYVLSLPPEFGEIGK